MASPTLLDLVVEASRRKVCWWIGCSTCGALELRSGVVLLARQVPLRLREVPVQEDPQLSLALGETHFVDWRRIVSPPVPTPLLSAAHEAEALTDACVRARLDDVARAATFPDWLGYLGMILFMLGRFENCRLRIGREWARQFVRMGGGQATWAPFADRAMSWGDLELAETEQLGAYNRSA